MQDKYLCEIDRNMQLVNALESALVAMRLTDGCAITMLGIRGRLNFEREIEKMVGALRLLGADIPSVSAAVVALNRMH